VISDATHARAQTVAAIRVTSGIGVIAASLAVA
jgi:hypothetical protein